MFALHALEGPFFDKSLIKCHLLEIHIKKDFEVCKDNKTILTLFETGPHCRTCGAPQRTPLWPGLQPSWSLQTEVSYIIGDTPVGLQAKVIKLVAAAQ